MRLLIWAVFIAGVVAAGVLGGEAGAFVYFVAVLFVIAVFRRPLVLALTCLSSQLGLMGGTIQAMPPAIVLTRAAGPTDAARPILAALAAGNFTDAGAWNIVQMPQIHLSLMVQREEGMLAAVESASPIGAHVNVHTRRTQLPRCSPDALLVRARAERPKTPFRPIAVDEAPRVYEQLYADDIRFRKAMGK